jgi:transcriptional regulator with XRE-family HTH domain
MSKDADRWENEFWRGFGQRLRIARVSAGKSESEAAAALEMTVRTYRRWESGLPGRGHQLSIPRFAEACDVTLVWLFCGGGPGPRTRLRLVV